MDDEARDMDNEMGDDETVVEPQVPPMTGGDGDLLGADLTDSDDEDAEDEDDDDTEDEDEQSSDDVAA